MCSHNLDKEVWNGELSGCNKAQLEKEMKLN